MKNLIKTIVLGLLISISYTSYAQQYVGAKANLQYSSISLDGIETNDLIDPSYIETFSTGLFYHVEMGDQFFFRPELSYTKKGFDAKLGMDLNILDDIDLPIGAGLKSEFNYIETVLNLGYTINLGKAKVQFSAGPTIGYASSAVAKPYVTAVLTINTGKMNLDLSNDIYNRFELGADIGLNFALPIKTGEILLNGRYNKSFTNFLDDPVVDIKIKHRSVAFGIGYMHRI